MIDVMYDFSKPLEVVELLRLRQTLPTETEENDRGVTVVTEVEVKNVDYSYRSAILWENIEAIRDYCYTDDWANHKGPKCYLTIAGQEQDTLILGSYDKMLEYWIAYRAKISSVPSYIPIHDPWTQKFGTGDFPNFPVTTSTDLPNDGE